MPYLYGLLAWAMGSWLGSVLVGGGLTLVVALGIEFLIEEALGMAVSAAGTLPGKAFQVAMLIGVGEFISIVGAAMLTRVAIVAAAGVLGVKRAAAA